MADLALLVLTFLWGTTFHFVKGALEVASPGIFLATRFAVAAVVLGAVAMLHRPALGERFWRHSSILGLFMLGGFALQTLGLKYTTPSRSGFLTGLSVLMVPFIARFLLGRRVRAASWAGVALAVVGLVFLTRPVGEELADAIRLGDALSAGCAVAFAFQIAFTSEWSPRHPLVPLTFVQLAVTFAGALLLVPLEASYLHDARSVSFWGTVAFTGVLMTAVAFFVMNWAQRRTTAVRAALIFSLEPVAAALFSHLYGGEPIGLADWTGGGLIAAGVVVAEVGSLLGARAEGGRPSERAA